VTELKLHDYQQKAVDFALSRDEAWFTMDCGTGKTIPAIKVAEELLLDARCRGVLIVAPLKVMYLVWPPELKKWSWMTHGVLHGPKKLDVLHGPRKCVYLINYEGLPWLRKNLSRNIRQWPFDVLFFDESSKMKNPDSSRFRKWRHVFGKMQYRLNLTASPRANGLEDLWGQAFMLDQGERLGTTITEYRGRWFHKRQRDDNFYHENKGAAEVVHSRIADLCFRVSREESRDYPDCQVIDIEIPLDKETLRDYRRLESEMFLTMAEGEVEAINAAVLTGKCLQFAGGNVYDDERLVLHAHNRKLEKLVELRREHRDEPMIVAYGYQHEADAICQKFPEAVDLRKHKTGPALARVMERWNNGEILMLVLHPASGGHGLNLQYGGRIVVWYGLNWSYDFWEQLNSRVWRQGQTKECLVYRLIADGTIDAVVVSAIERKARGQAELFEVLENYRQSYLHVT